MVKSIVTRFNEIIDAVKPAFEDENCGDDIEEIPESVLSQGRNYPPACYGTPKDISHQTTHKIYPCLLPCELYNYDEYWCPAKRALGCLEWVGPKPPGNPSREYTINVLSLDIGQVSFGMMMMRASCDLATFNNTIIWVKLVIVKWKQ